jgi:hypothetical protein
MLSKQGCLRWLVGFVELPQVADPAAVAAGQQLVKLAELLQQVYVA